MWVVQEVVLAPKNRCVIGSQEVDFMAVLKAAMWIEYKYRFVPTSLSGSSGRRNATTMAALINQGLGLEIGQQDSSRPLSYLLNLARRFTMTEPRDSVFAVLGLSRSKDVERHRPNSLIAPNYTKPLSAVVRDAVRCALLEDNDLSILGCVDLRAGNIDAADRLPSWVLYSFVQADQWLDVNELPSFYEACRGLSPPTLLGQIPENPDHLLLEGFVADAVASVSAICVASEWGSRAWAQSWLLEVHDMGRLCLSGKVTEAQFRQEITLALTAGQNREGSHADQEYLKHCWNVLRSLEEIEQMPIEFFYSCNRCFMTTKSGRLGLAPGGTQPEDVIAVLRGGRLPFVLRRTSRVDRHSLLGAAYVGRLMDGEAVSQFRRSDGTEEVFHVT